MPLHAIWFLKKGDQRPSEVLPFGRVEILGAFLVQLADLLIEFVVHSFLTGALDTELDVIAVLPLIPGQMMKADKQTFDPLFGGPFPLEGVIVALLDLAPLFGEQTFQQIFPANEGLRLGCLLHFRITEVMA